MTLILASSSPRRRELLAQAELDFSTLSVDIDEAILPNEAPTDYIQRMVASKAQAAVRALNSLSNLDSLSDLNNKDDIIIITADTIGVLPDGKTVLVKPIDVDDARAMWQKMSDATHQVWTAVTVTKAAYLPDAYLPDNEKGNKKAWQMSDQKSLIERTDVTFVPLTDAMMQRYWDSGEPQDKAGGYGIQGLAAAWVAKINGSYTNVVGLPLAQTLALLKPFYNEKF